MTEDQITHAAALIEMRLRGRAMSAAAKTYQHKEMILSLQPAEFDIDMPHIEPIRIPVESAIALGEWIQQHATMELEKLGVDL